MDKHRWQVLKSRRDLIHRTERRRKKAGEMQHKRETPAHLRGTTPARKPLQVPEVSKVETPKIASKPGIFKRLFRRVTGV